MNVPLPFRIAFIPLALVSLIWFPWAASILLAFFAGLVLPLSAFGLGVIADLLYYPGNGLPWGTILGLILTLLAAAVRYFVKTRIM